MKVTKMEDMSKKIQEILNDEESMRQINELAQMFSSGDEGEESTESTDSTSEGGMNIDPSKLLMLQSIMSGANGGKDTELLLALKPLLKDERRARVDKAVKILKLISAVELLKDSGMLGDIFGGI